MKPPDRKKAPAHASNTEPGKNQKYGNPTQSTAKRQPQFRFGQVTAGDLVPLVMADFGHLAADPIVDRAPRRREADQSRLLSILDELDGTGGRQ